MKILFIGEITEKSNKPTKYPIGSIIVVINSSI